ncbi:MAG TPA: hypothetical protein VGP40_00320 [Chthoniobacterales bacterium]|nr:hypothetical protein [Chthoniobacterales bacterium]
MAFGAQRHCFGLVYVSSRRAGVAVKADTTCAQFELKGDSIAHKGNDSRERPKN